MTRDWFVTFARKVAYEQDYTKGHSGARFCVMLKREEAEGLLEQVNGLVQKEAIRELVRTSTDDQLRQDFWRLLEQLEQAQARVNVLRKWIGEEQADRILAEALAAQSEGSDA